jgi:molybdopterin-binding protein
MRRDGSLFTRKESPMKLSARNVLPGKVVDVKRGATTSHIRIDIGGGAIVTASITNEAVDELALKTGDKAAAVIKASDVIVGKL